jgi:hypothetical protein
MGIASASLAATQPAGLSDGELMMASVQSMIKIRVEYCLRNVPELREELALTHQSFSLEAAKATELLKRRFPGSNRTVRFENSKMSQDFALQQARSEGFDLLCPKLLDYMITATAESLAKHYGDQFAAMKK